MKRVLALTLGLTLLPLSALAAVMSVSPATVTTEAGKTFSIAVVADTQGVALNQGEAKLTFPTDLLEAVSASRSGSVFTLWVTEPTISNALGSISFNGGAPTPGFTGTKQAITTVTFKAKKVGTATISLTGAALRANDGKGTDVLSGVTGTTIRITEASTRTAAPATKSVKETPAGEALKVSASFIYDADSGTLAVSGIDATGTSSPVLTYELSVDGGTLEEVTPLSGGLVLRDLGKSLAPGIHTATLRISYATGEYAEISQTFTISGPLEEQSLGSLFGLPITLGWFVPFVICILILSLLATAISMLALRSYGSRGNSKLQKRNIMLHRTLYEYKESLQKHLRSIQLAGTLRELTPEEMIMNQEFVREIDALEKRLASELKKYD